MKDSNFFHIVRNSRLIMAPDPFDILACCILISGNLQLFLLARKSQ